MLIKSKYIRKLIEGKSFKDKELVKKVKDLLELYTYLRHGLDDNEIAMINLAIEYKNDYSELLKELDKNDEQRRLNRNTTRILMENEDKKWWLLNGGKE